MNNEEIFKYFDKGQKYYLTKQELQNSLIYKFGYKFAYDEIRCLWKGRVKFEQQRTDFNALFDKNSVQKGVSFNYFCHIIASMEQQISQDKKRAVEFQILDEDDKGFITFEDFKKLISKHRISFIQPSQLREVFKVMDVDADEKVSLFDFRQFVKNYNDLA